MTTAKNNKVSSPAPQSNFGKVVFYLGKAVDALSGGGGAFAAVMLAIMMFLTFVDVAGRYIFNKPVIGSFEITEFIMGLLVSFTLAYCGMKKGHIRVDMVLQYLPAKVTRWLDIFAYALCCVFFAVVTWQSCLNAIDNISTHASSSVLLIPFYPFNFMLVLGSAFLTLIFLRDFLQSIEEVPR